MSFLKKFDARNYVEYDPLYIWFLSRTLLGAAYGAVLFVIVSLSAPYMNKAYWVNGFHDQMFNIHNNWSWQKFNDFVK